MCAHSESKNIGPVFSYGKVWPDLITSQFKHLKQEMINNPYSPITEKTWNGILKKCDKILKVRTTHRIHMLAHRHVLHLRHLGT